MNVLRWPHRRSLIDWYVSSSFEVDFCSGFFIPDSCRGEAGGAGQYAGGESPRGGAVSSGTSIGPSKTSSRGRLPITSWHARRNPACAASRASATASLPGSSLGFLPPARGCRHHTETQVSSAQAGHPRRQRLSQATACARPASPFMNGCSESATMVAGAHPPEAGHWAHTGCWRAKAGSGTS